MNLTDVVICAFIHLFIYGLVNVAVISGKFTMRKRNQVSRFFHNHILTKVRDIN